MEPLERSLESELSEEGNARWLRQCHENNDINGLLEAALLLNLLYHQERIKVRWAIREAAENLHIALQDRYR